MDLMGLLAELRLEWILAYMGLGVFVGFWAGLMGVGGGGIIVPVLTAFFSMQGFPAEHLVHMALASSMATIIFTSISSLKAHHSRGAVLWPVVTAISPGILAGTFFGAIVAGYISEKPLAIFFVLFMGYLSLQMLLNVKPKPSRELPGKVGLTVVGCGIGLFSALVAIGGGSLTVPFMTWCNVRMQQAIGTSSAIGLPIALAGTLGYIASGWTVSNVPVMSFGYIYLPAVLAISVCSLLTARFGAELAHRLPVPLLKKLFAFMLMGLAIKMWHTVV